MKQLRDPAKAGTGREVSSKVGVGERGWCFGRLG